MILFYSGHSLILPYPVDADRTCLTLNSTVLYCTVLYCTVLYCTVLYCTVLYCTVLYCTVLTLLRPIYRPTDYRSQIVGFDCTYILTPLLYLLCFLCSFFLLSLLFICSDDYSLVHFVGSHHKGLDCCSAYVPLA